MIRRIIRLPLKLIAEWIAGAPSSMAYQCLGLGLFLLAAPHLASWIIGKAADLLYRVLGFITA